MSVWPIILENVYYKLQNYDMKTSFLTHKASVPVYSTLFLTHFGYSDVKGEPARRNKSKLNLVLLICLYPAIVVWSSVHNRIDLTYRMCGMENKVLKSFLYQSKEVSWKNYLMTFHCSCLELSKNLIAVWVLPNSSNVWILFPLFLGAKYY